MYSYDIHSTYTYVYIYICINVCIHMVAIENHVAWITMIHTRCLTRTILHIIIRVYIYV